MLEESRLQEEMIFKRKEFLEGKQGYQTDTFLYSTGIVIHTAETNSEGNIVSCNEKFAKLFGYESPEILAGRPMNQLQSNSIAQIQNILISKFIKTGHIDLFFREILFPCKKKDGSAFLSYVTMKPFYDFKANSMQVVAAFVPALNYSDSSLVILDHLGQIDA